MSNIRKLSAFRQLSLNCSPTPEQRRKTLKKQFSEDIPDYKEKWINPDIGIKISLNAKANRNLDRPPPIRIAWEENTPEDAVIIKKCKEVRRGSTGKLSRRSSLEKNSILHSKQELAERFKQNVKEKEQEKTNLKIFLAHNSKEQNEDIYSNQSDRDTVHYLEKNYERPKLIQPLMTNNVSNNSKNLFQIRRNFRPKINLNELAYSPTSNSESESSIRRNDTVVVVPIVEQSTCKQDHVDNARDTKAKDGLKPIDSIIIRPATAASKREKFQKRTSSVFNATIKESPHNRPPLIRSSSAPSKSERGRQKFSATKRKVKTIKRVQLKNRLGDGELEDTASNKENPKSQKELNRTAAANGSEIITMVSLVSPAGSDVEEESQEETKEKNKNKTNSTNNKNTLKEDKEQPRNMSLRKIVKTVSFQQSSIHAIRSFSASFPSRRGSMATALMLGNGSKSSAFHGTKVQEKRSTNSSSPDDDERVPKRRLLRSDTQEQNTTSCELKPSEQNELTDCEEKPETKPNFSVAIKSKIVTEPENSSTSTAIDTQSKDSPVNETVTEEIEKSKENTKYESQKEKQCWEMYCKMTEKGINVSFDTILRGMLTPTEYRMSRKKLIVEQDEEPEATE